MKLFVALVLLFSLNLSAQTVKKPTKEPHSVTLSWKAGSTDTYEVFKRTEKGKYDLKKPIAVTRKLQFQDFDVKAGKTYYYTVASVHGEQLATAPEVKATIPKD